MTAKASRFEEIQTISVTLEGDRGLIFEAKRIFAVENIEPQITK
jgi:hypothetical protein